MPTSVGFEGGRTCGGDCCKRVARPAALISCAPGDAVCEGVCVWDGSSNNKLPARGHSSLTHAVLVVFP